MFIMQNQCWFLCTVCDAHECSCAGLRMCVCVSVCQNQQERKVPMVDLDLKHWMSLYVESNSFCSYCMLPLVALGLSFFSLVPGPVTKLVSSTSCQTCEVIEMSSSLRSKGFVGSARESKAFFNTLPLFLISTMELQSVKQISLRLPALKHFLLLHLHQCELWNYWFPCLWVQTIHKEPERLRN